MNLQIRINIITGHPVAIVAFKDKQYSLNPQTNAKGESVFRFGKTEVGLARTNRFYIKCGKSFFNASIHVEGKELIIEKQSACALQDLELLKLPVSVYSLVGK